MPDGYTQRRDCIYHIVRVDERLTASNTVDRRSQSPPETALLLGEAGTLEYEDLQREFGQLIHGELWGTRRIQKWFAKTGAWVQDVLPLGGEPFVKPWMIDLADDHYPLDISRAGELLEWEPQHALRATLPAMVAALRADPQRRYRENRLDPPHRLMHGRLEKENS